MTLRKHTVISALLFIVLTLFSCGEAQTTGGGTYQSICEYPIEAITFKNGEEHFDGAKISTVQNLYVESDNQTYVSLDGVIFTKDEKTLIAYPAGRKGDFIVPDGTEKIGESAFADCRVENVYIPDSVKSIGKGAFSGCMSLKELSIPNGISCDGEVLPRSTVTPEYPLGGIIIRFRDCDTEKVDTRKVTKTFPELIEREDIQYGSWVDGTDGRVMISRNRYGFLRYEGNDEIYMTYSAAYLTEGGNVAVPEGYSGIEKDDLRMTKRPIYAWTFQGNATAEIITDYNTAIEDLRESILYLHIDEASSEFTSVDGVVFTKDMKTLVAFPAGRTGHYTVPDGTEVIGENAFFCTSLDGITFPSSITEIHEQAFASKWEPMLKALTLSFAADKDAAEELLTGVFGDYEITYRDIK